MRMRKKKHGAERMQACSDIWITEPGKYKGHWRDELAKDRRLCLEIGCGKGTFICEMARRHPEKFFVAIEKVPDVALLAMEKAKAAELSNVRFICGDAGTLCEAFDDGELNEIYLNFSDPWPKKGLRNADSRTEISLRYTTKFSLPTVPYTSKPTTEDFSISLSKK